MLIRMVENVKKAISELRKGNLVLIHDSDGRENETDLMVAAEFITPEIISTMRTDGGGLICAAIDKKLAETINLPFMVDILNTAREEHPLLKFTTPDDIPYDEKSSFALNVNHRETFTGITDSDRALTIRKLVELFKDNPTAEEFGRQFRSPGHVFLLISSGLENREGHTELTTALLEMGGLTPVSCICEMMDSVTHKALSAVKAREYAELHNFSFLEVREIKDYFRQYKFSASNR